MGLVVRASRQAGPRRQRVRSMSLESLARLWVPRPLPGGELQPERRAGAAIEWIRRAHAATGGQGISKGYDLVRRRWYPPYPETTGYTVPSLLNASVVLGEPELRRLALSLADGLLELVTPEGGVAHWADPRTGPIAFDTGQVVFGWLAAYDASGDERYLAAARTAGDWLVSVQGDSGSWVDHQHLGVEKVIDTRVAWALLELHSRTSWESYRRAAVLNLEWAMQHQDADGWFRQCAFAEGEDPITHTLAYAARGLLEGGLLLSREDCIGAGRLVGDALLARQRGDGWLASTYGPGWRETSASCCLTGNCQMGLLWLRLHELSGDRAYRTAAELAVSFAARTQRMGARDRNIRGGIAGSWPIFGWYERLKYPNWAAKFFTDAVLALAGPGECGLPYVG